MPDGKHQEGYVGPRPTFVASTHTVYKVETVQQGYRPQTVYTAYSSPLVIGAGPQDPDMSKLRCLNVAVIVFSVISTIFFLNPAFGIPSIILAVLGRKDFNMGRKKEGKLKTGLAFGLSVLAILISVAVAIFYIVIVTRARHRYTERYDGY